MKQEEALQAILREWFKLLESERDSEQKAALFAFRILKDRPDITNFRASGISTKSLRDFYADIYLEKDSYVGCVSRTIFGSLEKTGA